MKYKSYCLHSLTIFGSNLIGSLSFISYMGVELGSMFFQAIYQQKNTCYDFSNLYLKKACYPKYISDQFNILLYSFLKKGYLVKRKKMKRTFLMKVEHDLRKRRRQELLRFHRYFRNVLFMISNDQPEQGNFVHILSII